MVRLIVLNQIDPHPRNAPWELFGTRQDQIRHGAAHDRPRRKEAWELLRCLYLTHILEDPTMAYTMEEFAREAHQRFLQELTPEELRAMLDQLPPEEGLRGLGPEERLRGLGPEELRQLEDTEKVALGGGIQPAFPVTRSVHDPRRTLGCHNRWRIETA